MEAVKYFHERPSTREFLATGKAQEMSNPTNYPNGAPPAQRVVDTNPQRIHRDTLGNLVDVCADAPADGEVLGWSAAEQHWCPGAGAAVEGANVTDGSGVGVFRDRTGTTLNFHSLVGGTALSAADTGNDITLDVQLNGGAGTAAEDDKVVHLAGSETVTGAKTFRAQQRLQSDATYAAIVGADQGATTLTDATLKQGVIAAPHYTNAEEPVGMVFASSSVGNNVLYLGGGRSDLNSATSILLHAGNTTTTTTGTQVAQVTNQGFAVGTGAQANAQTVFNVESTTQASQFAPRMTSTERNNITGLDPTHAGVSIYNSSTAQHEYWTGGSWQPIVGVHQHTLADITDSGSAAAADLGTGAGEAAEVGAALGPFQTVVTDGSAKLISDPIQSGHNLPLGTTAGTVAAGDHTHDAGDVISGTFADARISASSVQQHPATKLKSATTEVDVSAAAAPTPGQVLQASSATDAAWVTPAVGAGASMANVTDGGGVGVFRDETPVGTFNLHSLKAGTAASVTDTGNDITIGVSLGGGAGTAADDGDVVHKAGAETVTGTKTFSVRQDYTAVGEAIRMTGGSAGFGNKDAEIGGRNWGDAPVPLLSWDAEAARERLYLGKPGKDSADTAIRGSEFVTLSSAPSSNSAATRDVLTAWEARGVFIQDGANDVFATSGLDPKTLLQLDSTSRGFLEPRMTTAQRTAITSVPNGLQVYDTDLNAMFVYSSSSWKEVDVDGHTHVLADITDSGGAAALNVGTTAGTVAAGDHGIADHGDVVLAGLANGDALIYSAGDSEWKNQNIATGNLVKRRYCHSDIVRNMASSNAEEWAPGVADVSPGDYGSWVPPVDVKLIGIGVSISSNAAWSISAGTMTFAIGTTSGIHTSANWTQSGAALGTLTSADGTNPVFTASGLSYSFSAGDRVVFRLSTDGTFAATLNTADATVTLTFEEE